MVIPTYNEENILADTLTKSRDFLLAHFPDSEIIVSDDGSHDQTVQLAERFDPAPLCLTVIKNRHRGKGQAVKQGILTARGRHIIFSDADLSTPLETILSLKKELEAGREVVIGSRALLRSQIAKAQPPYRSVAGKVFNWLVRSLFGLDSKDTQCGLKGFSRPAAQAIFRRLSLDGFAFDVEVLVTARRLGYQIAEVPVTWSNRPPTRLKLWRDPLKMLGEILRLKWTVSVG